MVSPHAQRQAVQCLVTAHQMSERHACRVLNVARSTVRYQAHRPERLVQTVREFAYRYPPHGYRHITALMHRAGYLINHKCVARIWQQEG